MGGASRPSSKTWGEKIVGIGGWDDLAASFFFLDTKTCLLRYSDPNLRTVLGKPAMLPQGRGKGEGRRERAHLPQWSSPQRGPASLIG